MAYGAACHGMPWQTMASTMIFYGTCAYTTELYVMCHAIAWHMPWHAMAYAMALVLASIAWPHGFEDVRE